eukprot:RCo045124
MEHFPCGPKKLVGLFGCETFSQGLLEFFTANAPEPTSNFCMKVFDPERVSARPKKERRSYELYTPAGILPTHWCSKHQDEVFSAIIVVVDWSSSGDRAGFEGGVSTVLDHVRASMRGRSVKLVLALLNGPEVTQLLSSPKTVLGAASTMPFFLPGEDPVSVLRRRFEMEPKTIFVLSCTCFGELADASKKLMRICLEQSALQIREVARLVKKHKNDVSKSTQQFLFTRHRFKAGWYFEMIREHSLAIKQFQQAFAYLQSVPTDQFSRAEICAVSEVICGHMLYNQLWGERDAKAAFGYFREHVRWYRSFCGVEFPGSGPAASSPAVQPRTLSHPLAEEDSALLSSIATASSHFATAGCLLRMYIYFADNLSAGNVHFALSHQQCPGYYYKAAAEIVYLQKKLLLSSEEMYDEVR